MVDLSLILLEKFQLHLQRLSLINPATTPTMVTRANLGEIFDSESDDLRT